MRLYHYSNQDFKGKIEPRFFGVNSYTRNSARLSGVKRSYFYIDNQSREVYFKTAKFCYIAEVKESQLYNINEDKLKVVKKLKNTQDIFTYLKNKGYAGLIGSNGFNCAVIFKAVKIKQKEAIL